MMTIMENTPSGTTPNSRPTIAKISPTSPRGTMPLPTSHLLALPAARPDASLPATAATVIAKAASTIFGSAKLARSTCIPV